MLLSSGGGFLALAAWLVAGDAGALAALLKILTHSYPVPGPSKTQATHSHLCNQRNFAHTTHHLRSLLRTPPDMCHPLPS